MRSATLQDGDPVTSARACIPHVTPWKRALTSLTASQVLPFTDSCSVGQGRLVLCGVVPPLVGNIQICHSSKAVLLIWFSVFVCFGVSFFTVLVSSVKVAEWPPFGRELLVWFSYVLFVFLLSVILDISHFCFEGGTLVLVVSIPGHCLSFTFYITRPC